MTMTAAHPSPEQLQLHLDGELPEAERAQLLGHIAECDTCVDQLATFRRLGNLIRVAAADSETETDLDFARMLANVERAVAIESSADVRSIKSAAKPAVRKVRWIYRGAPALGAVALAAAALLMVYHPDSNDDINYDSANPPSEIVEVDFGSNAGTVFDIPLSDGSSTPVVWIDDDDDDED
jgi:anti-sigma factor RsiW